MIDEGDCGQLGLKRLHACIFEEHPGTSEALYSTYYDVRHTNCNLTYCIVQILCELGCIAFQICNEYSYLTTIMSLKLIPINATYNLSNRM